MGDRFVVRIHGGGVWGSTIAIDTKRNSAYVTTGNNYSVPDSVKQCVANAIDSAATSACTPPDVLFDSVLALNLDTGAIKWSTRLWDYDAWNVACIPFLPGAPPGYAALCPKRRNGTARASKRPPGRLVCGTCLERKSVGAPS